MTDKQKLELLRKVLEERPARFAVEHHGYDVFWFKAEEALKATEK